MYIFLKKKTQQKKVKSPQTPSWSSSWSLVPSLGTMSLPHRSLTPFFFNALLAQSTHFFFNWRLITILWWFLPYIHMNQPWVYMCSPSWTLLPPPSPSHPSGSSQWTSPEHPVSCIEPGLEIYFTYDNIHLSMLFSQIIPPLPLPQSPKDCSIHLCLFCYLAYRVIVTIFLNFIYMR